MLRNGLSGLLLILSAGTLSATTLQQLDVDQMTQNATAIVRARVTGSWASWTGSTIYTHYQLQITETWKGSPGAEVMLPGGAAGGYRQTFPGVPQLQAGSEYLLFLWKSTSGVTHLIGLSQGLFNVTQQPDGSVEASRPLIGETMLDSSGRQVRDQPIRMKLSDMKARVAARIASGGLLQ